MKIQRLSNDTIKFLEINQFKKLTRIQDAVVDVALSGSDLVAISETGTGKTHAYLIPIMEMIDPSLFELQAIITVPTRELGYQIYRQVLKMTKIHSNLRVKIGFGGSERKRVDQIKVAPQILIATPGRLKDLLEREYIDVSTCKLLVIDEADMTLEYGFLDDLSTVLNKLVKTQILCFSATYPTECRHFVKKYFHNPKLIEINDNSYMNPQIDFYATNAKHRQYHEVLVDVLKCLNPYVCLIFANTKQEAILVSQYLRSQSYKVLEIHADLKDRKRKQAIKQLESQEYTYVVCSDIAARGLDIDAVSHVISLGLPSDLNFFTHRAGRTGRSGRKGMCITIYNQNDLKSLTVLNEKYHFIFASYTRGIFKLIKTNPLIKRVYDDKKEKEIAKTLKNKKEKVKPNYKKKKRELVLKIKKKQRQEFIRQKIKEQRKERYKKQARELYRGLKND